MVAVEAGPRSLAPAIVQKQGNQWSNSFGVDYNAALTRRRVQFIFDSICSYFFSPPIKKFKLISGGVRQVAFPFCMPVVLKSLPGFWQN